MARSMADLLAILAQRVREALDRAFGESARQADPQIRPAQNPKFGDYQINAAMSLAKVLKSQPRQVAQQLVDALELDDWAEPPQIAGPGFINITLRDEALGKLAGELAADERLGLAHTDQPQTVVVDYSSPNVAKEMHVGHLRSTVIGDAIARTLELLGHRVVRQNHIGDWGTQFGMLIENLIETFSDDALMGMSFDIGDLNNFYKAAKQKFDTNLGFADRSRKRVVALQSGDAETVELWRTLYVKSLEHFDRTYDRLNVSFDPGDGDIRGESFYNDKLPGVIEALDRAGLLQTSEGAAVVYPEGFVGRDGEPLAMIVRKSDGGFLYATTDLAAVRYRVNELQARRVIYVTDARQKQHFSMVFKTAEMAGWVEESVHLEHVPFGTILGEDNKPFKTRSGETVKLEDLLDEAESRAAAIVAEKNPDLTEDERQRVAQVVGIGAIKYADLSNDRIKDYVFSWDRMLSMEGNTAPYLQYAYTRIRSIFRKAEVEAESLGGQAVTVSHPAERALVLKIAQWPDVVGQVAVALEPHRLCNWLYDLAVAYSAFYEHCPVIRADDEPTRRSRLALCDLTCRVLKQGLHLLGIDVLERM